jgi:hypothetical protein
MESANPPHLLAESSKKLTYAVCTFSFPTARLAQPVSAFPKRDRMV